MKRKHIRTIAISALVLLIAVVAFLRIDIEPAGQTMPLTTDASQAVNTQEPSAKPVTGEKVQIEDPEPSAQITESEPPSEAENAPEQAETPSPAPDEMLPAVTATPEPEASAETPDLPEPTPEPVPEPSPEPAAPEGHICTIEIRCDTVVDTSKLENEAVAPFVPASGVILETTEMEFAPGESVFDILLRATKDRNIHMEFRDDNLYSGKYIEGINYLYEMDAGPLSGWMYKVNDLFPNYGCAAYKVNDGDRIVWIYTCDLGVDVGDNSTW